MDTVRKPASFSDYLQLTYEQKVKLFKEMLKEKEKENKQDN